MLQINKSYTGQKRGKEEATAREKKGGFLNQIGTGLEKQRFQEFGKSDAKGPPASRGGEGGGMSMSGAPLQSKRAGGQGGSYYIGRNGRGIKRNGDGEKNLLWSVDRKE